MRTLGIGAGVWYIKGFRLIGIALYYLGYIHRRFHPRRSFPGGLCV